VEAGADVVLAPAYLTHRRALSPYGETRRAAEWTRSAVEVAREAVEEALEAAAGATAPARGVAPAARLAAPSEGGAVAVARPADSRVLLAGPMSPLLPGRFEPALDPGVLAEEDRARADMLVEAGVDLLLVETMPSLAEARSAASAAVATGIPLWLGLQLAQSGTHLPAGDDLEAVWEELAELPLEALLVTPFDSDGPADALEWVARFVDMPLGAWLPMPQEDTAGRDSLADRASRWLDAGARVLGLTHGAVPERLTDLRAVIDERTAAAQHQRRIEDGAWLNAVADAAERAPGGRALWLGASVPDPLPAGFDWTATSSDVRPSLPERAFRFLVAAAGDDLADVLRLSLLLDDGGYLLIRSSGPLTVLPEELERLGAQPSPGGTITLLRRTP